MRPGRARARFGRDLDGGARAGGAEGGGAVPGKARNRTRRGGSLAPERERPSLLIVPFVPSLSSRFRAQKTSPFSPLFALPCFGRIAAGNRAARSEGKVRGNRPPIDA